MPIKHFFHKYILPEFFLKQSMQEKVLLVQEDKKTDCEIYIVKDICMTYNGNNRKTGRKEEREGPYRCLWSSFLTI